MIKCLIDNTEHDCVEHLHLYLRKLKIKQADYYEQHVGRKDLFTNELIPYKDYDQYFSTDFLNKNNIKKYLKQYPEEGKKWAIEWLKKRKESKGLIYTPTQVELRSLNCPTIHYYESVGGYNVICQELGYKIRFAQKFPKNITTLPKCDIIIDTREQRPLSIKNHKIIFSKVECGDYALEEKYDKKVYIERKGLTDFLGTMTKDLGRFEREIQRAKENSSYLVILVEANIADCTAFNFARKFETRYVKTTPQHVFKNVRDLLHKYDNIQFLFVDGRVEAASAVIKVFELGELVKHIDLQQVYESGDLKL